MRRGNWTDNPCWYVSIRDAGRWAFVLGPFAAEAAAREWAYSADSAEPGGNTEKHSRLLAEAEKRDCRAWFYGWGMAKAPNGHCEGVLNAAIRADGLWTGEAL